MSLENFSAPYLFQKDNTVVIRHKHGKHIRVHPEKEGQLDAYGAEGVFAQWDVHIAEPGIIQLQNVQSKRFLRIHADGHEIDVRGIGGEFTRFKVHVIEQPNVVHLESERFPGHYIAVHPDLSVAIGKGGPFCQLTFYRQPEVNVEFHPEHHHHHQQQQQQQPPPQQPPQQQPQPIFNEDEKYGAPYLFQQDNTVVIRHAHGRYLRVSPLNLTSADGEGGTGEFARWKAELQGNGIVKLQSEKTGKYLRVWQRGEVVDVEGGGGPFTDFKIHFVQQPNCVKLESEQFPGRFVAVGENGNVHVTEGGNHTSLTFYREGFIQQQQQQQQQQPFQQPFQQPPQQDPPHFLPIIRWLTSIGMAEYIYKFRENRFDRIEAVGHVSEGDLQKMGIPIGHIKIIIQTIALVEFIGHRVTLQSHMWGKYVAAQPLKNEHHKFSVGHLLKRDHEHIMLAELHQSDKVDGNSTWICEYIGEGKVAFRNVAQNCYLSIRETEGGEAKGVPEAKDWELMKIVTAKSHGCWGIYCDAQNKYLSMSQVQHKIEQKSEFHGWEEWKINVVD